MGTVIFSVLQMRKLKFSDVVNGGAGFEPNDFAQICAQVTTLFCFMIFSLRRR